MASQDTRSSLAARWLAPIAELRPGEGGTALLLFLYSFLAMTSYNILKPLTRSQFIKNLGADNLPWVLLAAGVLIGVIMQGYSKGVALLPRKWVIPITQTIMAGVLVSNLGVGGGLFILGSTILVLSSGVFVFAGRRLARIGPATAAKGHGRRAAAEPAVEGVAQPATVGVGDGR